MSTVAQADPFTTQTSLQYSYPSLQPMDTVSSTHVRERKQLYVSGSRTVGADVALRAGCRRNHVRVGRGAGRHGGRLVDGSKGERRDDGDDISNEAADDPQDRSGGVGLKCGIDVEQGLWGKGGRS